MPEIIYVEDSAADRHLALAAHQQSGVSTPLRFFASGEEFFTYLDSLPAGDRATRIVLLDLNMPRLNGMEVLQRIKSQYKDRQLLVWMFSNSSRHTEHEKLRKAGAVRFISKPVDHSLTITLIQELSRRLGEILPATTQAADFLHRVLLIEDSEADAATMTLKLYSEVPQLEVVRVKTIAKACEVLERQSFDGVILDLHLPDSQGVDGLGKIVEQRPHLPIVAISGEYDQLMSRAVIRAGAQDFLLKGALTQDSLIRSLDCAVERQWVINHLRSELYRSREEALSDHLTGLPNRRHIEREYERHFSGEQTHQAWEVNALVVIDIDGLKIANDQFGHKLGDELIQIVAAALNRSLRLGDMLARVGGDEFLALFMGLPAGDWVEVLIERMRQSVLALPPLAAGAVRPSASFGYAVIPPEGMLFEEVFKAADAKMYIDKLAHRGYPENSGR